jgi:hypothetical protein
MWFCFVRHRTLLWIPGNSYRPFRVRRGLEMKLMQLIIVAAGIVIASGGKHTPRSGRHRLERLAAPSRAPALLLALLPVRPKPASRNATVTATHAFEPGRGKAEGGPFQALCADDLTPWCIGPRPTCYNGREACTYLSNRRR